VHRKEEKYAKFSGKKEEKMVLKTERKKKGRRKKKGEKEEGEKG